MLSPKEISRVQKHLHGKDYDLAELFKLLSDANRCTIVRTLAREPQLSVSDCAKILDISLPLASQHLKILAQGRLIVKERRGQSVNYQLNQSHPIVPIIVRVITEVQS